MVVYLNRYGKASKSGKRAIRPAKPIILKEVIGRGQTGPTPAGMLASLIKELYEIPSHVRKLVEARWELEKQLCSCRDEKETAKIEENLSLADRELEWLRCRQTAAVATVNLVAALTNAGRTEDVKLILDTLEEKQKRQDKNKGESAGKNNGEDKKRKEDEKKKDQEDDLKAGVFTVKEVKPGKSEGTVWAKVAAEDGEEYKVCTKNGNAETLSGAAGKKVRIRYRQMGEGKLYAASVEIIQK